MPKSLKSMQGKIKFSGSISQIILWDNVLLIYQKLFEKILILCDMISHLLGLESSYSFECFKLTCQYVVFWKLVELKVQLSILNTVTTLEEDYGAMKLYFFCISLLRFQEMGLCLSTLLRFITFNKLHSLNHH